MKKIHAGYYEGTYKGVSFTVTRVECVDASTKNKWYFQIADGDVDDWQNSKSEAIEAAKYVIDHPEEFA